MKKEYCSICDAKTPSKNVIKHEKGTCDWLCFDCMTRVLNEFSQNKEKELFSCVRIFGHTIKRSI